MKTVTPGLDNTCLFSWNLSCPKALVYSQRIVQSLSPKSCSEDPAYCCLGFDSSSNPLERSQGQIQPWIAETICSLVPRIDWSTVDDRCLITWWINLWITIPWLLHKPLIKCLKEWWSINYFPVALRSSPDLVFTEDISSISWWRLEWKRIIALETIR